MVSRIIALATVTVDVTLRTLTGPTGKGRLRAREAALLAYLADRPGVVVSREELFREVWGYRATVVSRALDTAIARLRSKIERDPANPVHLHTHRAEGYRFEPSDPASSETPLPATRFFGRARELAELERNLADGERRIALLGSAGCGKSRVALELARRMGAVPVAFADLGWAATRADVVAKVSHSMGTAPGARTLVLDRVEAVLDIVRAVANEWLAASPTLTVIVVSRERVGLHGERVHPIAPLDPDDAVALFEDRARASGATLSPDDRAVVPKLVEQLSRSPLLIEIVAAQTRFSPPEDQLAQMQGASTRAITATLRAALEPSLARLPPDQRRMFGQLSVFCGGFRAEDAVAVLGEDVTEALAALLDRSLVRSFRTRAGDARLGFDHWIRELAEAELDHDEVATLHERHARHAVEQADRAVTGDVPAIALRRVADDADNLLAAARRTRRRDPALVARAILALQPVLRGRLAAADLLDTVGGLPLDQLPSEIRPAVDLAIGEALAYCGRTSDAIVRIESATSGAGEVRGVAHARLAVIAYDQGRFDEAQRQVAAAAATGTAATRRLALYASSGIYLEGRLDEATALVVRALSSGPPDSLLAGALYQRLAVIRSRGGDLTGCIAACQRAVRIFDDNSCRPRAASALSIEGLAHAALGALEEAGDRQREALGLWSIMGDARGAAVARSNLAMVLVERGQFADADVLLDLARAAHERLGDESNCGWVIGNRAIAALVAGRAGEAVAAFDEALLRVARDPRITRWYRLWRALAACGSGGSEVPVDEPGDSPEMRHLVALMRWRSDPTATLGSAPVVRFAPAADLAADLRLAQRIATSGRY